MDFSPYIRELILLNECIILPGFGGFETRYKSAKVNKNEKILLPPSKEVIFRGDLIKDNGVLVGYVVEKTNMKESKVRKLLEEFTIQLIIKMQNGDKVLLPGVGTFWIDKDYFIHYKEFEDENYLADSYGLSPLDYKQKIKDDPRYNTNVELKPIAQIRRKRTWMWITAGIVIILISLFLLIRLRSKYLHNEDFNLFSFTGLMELFHHSENEKIIFGKQRIVEKDSVTRAIDETIIKHTRLKNALDYEQDNAASGGLQGNDRYEYFIVAGSFRSKQNAEKLRDNLVEFGYDPHIIQTAGGNYRVILKRFSNKQQAQEELQIIRSRLKHSVWLDNG